MTEHTKSRDELLTEIAVLRQHLAEAGVGKVLDEKYRRLVEDIQEGIWVIDGNASTTFVNSHMAKLLGYSPDEMVGPALFLASDAASFVTGQVLIADGGLVPR